jgi:hypothetical protein
MASYATGWKDGGGWWKMVEVVDEFKDWFEVK